MFDAKYPGPCAAECGPGIRPGDTVEYTDDGLMHVECARAPEPKQPDICAVCWTAKPCFCE